MQRCHKTPTHKPAAPGGRAGLAAGANPGTRWRLTPLHATVGIAPVGAMADAARG
jgi:hypothetical protein